MKERIEKYFSTNPDLRVLFFFDPEGEYLLEIELLELEGLRKVKYENNPFTLKTKFYGEWKNDRVFLYFNQHHPRTTEEYRNFPLLGLLLANKELALDDVGSFMEEFGLQRHQKGLVARYIKELKYIAIREVCRPVLTASRLEEASLVRGLVCGILKFKQIESWPVITGKLLSLVLPGQEAELARFNKRISGSGLPDSVLQHIRESAGIELHSLNVEEFSRALCCIFYNRITHPIRAAASNDPYKTVKITDPDLMTRLNQMLLEIDRSPLVREMFREALAHAANTIKGDIIVQVYGIDAPYACFTKEMVWEIIAQIQTNIIFNPHGIIKTLEEIILQPGLIDTVSGCVSFILSLAHTHSEINQIQTYILNHPVEYTAYYTNKGYLVDYYYRKSIWAYSELNTTDIPPNIDIPKMYQDLNAAYEKHLDTLNREWLKCLAQSEFDYHSFKTPKQYDFYAREIEPLNQKVVVIISDALRYEVAVELLSELHNDKKNVATIRYQLASIPSKTSIGMANLLPGNEFKFQDGKINIDGKSSEGIEYRQQILCMKKEDSRAIQFGDLKNMDRDQLRELFKNQVVYIYHDVIDATGDKRSTERRTLSAIKDAITELKLFLPKVHHTYNVAKVLITSDHGFLYNDRKISEKEKEDPVSPEPVMASNRYEVCTKKVNYKLGYQFPLSSTAKFKEMLHVLIPASVNRFKRVGVGHQFVHGGGSLQELVVPVIESSRKTEEVAQKVKPVLMKKGEMKIVSNILRIHLLQEKKVSRYEKESVLSVGLYKDSKLVSNEAIVTMDSISDTPSERTWRVELTLSPDAAGESMLKLKVFHLDDKLNPVIEELVPNNTLIQSEF